MIGPMPLRRIDFTTWDPAEAREFLDQTYGAGLQVGTQRDASAPFVVRGTAASAVTSTTVTIPADVTLTVRGRDQVVINTVVSGTVDRDRARGRDRYQAGDVYLAVCPHADWECRSHGDPGVNAITLTPALLAAVASNAPDHPGLQPEFSSFSPTAAGARQWRETAQFVDQLLAGPDVPGQLVIGSAARLLAATALAIFPSDATSDPAGPDRLDASPATVRRAVSFIEADPGRDISVADIAAAAHVTVRAVQLAFRRHLDTTPMAYLRRVRLDLAHRELLAADPARESVTSVANRWGFASPSRFASQYRASYGVTPRQTLQQDL